MLQKGTVEVICMVSCLILCHDDFAKSTVHLILKALLQQKDYEIVKQTKEKTIIFTWNIPKKMIWQYAFELEFSGIYVGYGFGNSKEKAKKNAIAILNKRFRFAIRNKKMSP